MTEGVKCDKAIQKGPKQEPGGTPHVTLINLLLKLDNSFSDVHEYVICRTSLTS